MKAAFVVEPGNVEIRQIDTPAINDDEVLIKVETAGLCDTDLWLFNGTHPNIKLPAILGRQLSGDVVRIGRNVKGIRMGDRVAVEPHRGCGVCTMCKRGLETLCANKIVPGTPTWTGAFVEYFNAPAKGVHRLNDNVEYEQGTLIEPLALAIHAVNRITQKQKNAIAVLGSGTAGLMALIAAHEAGFRHIVYTDAQAFHLAIAIRHGAKLALNTASEDIVSKVLAFTDGKGADVVLIAADADREIAVDLSLAMTREGGEVGILSTGQQPVFVDASRHASGDFSRFFVRAYRHRDFTSAVRMVNRGLDLHDFFTHRFPLSQSQQALETYGAGEEPVVKMVVDIDD